jgi:hypothetical protein
MIGRLFISDNLLYISNATSDLLIYNIQDIHNPQLIFNGNFAINYNFYELFVEDEVIYVCDGYNGLIAFNVSNPRNPQFISRYSNLDFSNRFYNLVVRDALVFASQGNILRVLNFSDINKPAQVGTFTLERPSLSFRRIILDEDKAYVCGYNGILIILNISDISNITQLGFVFDDSFLFVDFHAEGSIGYLLTYNEGLLVLDLTNLQQIKRIHSVYNPGNYQSLAFYNNYLFAIDENEGLEVYKINQDTYLEFVARFWDGGYGRDVIVDSNFAYVANGYNGLEIYKISNSLTPVLKSRFIFNFACQEIFLAKNLLYTFDYASEELHTLDVSNKRNPKIISEQSLILDLNNLTYYPSSIKIFGKQAFVKYYGIENYIAVLDLSNSSGFQVNQLIPFNTSSIYTFFFDSNYLYVISSGIKFQTYSFNDTHWNLLAEFVLPFSIQDFVVHENIAYIATNYDLLIYNLSDPFAPFVAAVFHGSESSYEGYDKVFVEGEFAYLIAEYNNDLHIVNIQDIENPYMEGTFNCNDTLTNLFVVDTFVYLTSTYVNLEIIQLERFVSLLNFVIFTPLIGIAVIIGVPIIVLVAVRIKRSRTAFNTTSITDLLPQEEITNSKPENRIPSISPEDFDDPELYALVKKIVETAEEDQ